MKKFMRTRTAPAPAPAAPPPASPAHKTNGHANGSAGARRDDHSTLSSRYWGGSAGSGSARAPLWEDAEFPPARALGARAGAVVWMRPHELSARPTFLGPEAGADLAAQWDVAVGELGSAALCGAAAALALTPRLLARVAPPHCFRSGYTGAFRFRFWVFGAWREVAVDDRLPCRAARAPRLLASTALPHDYLLPLLEKAYAKLYGSYAAMRAGAGDAGARALQELSGGVVQAFSLARQPAALTLQVLHSAAPRSTLIVAGGPRGPAPPLPAAAAYCVAGLARVRSAPAPAATLRGRGVARRVGARLPRVARAGAARPRPARLARAAPRRVLDVVLGLRAGVLAAGAGARGAGRLDARAGAARAAALARRAGPPPLAQGVQRRRPARGRGDDGLQPAVPRADPGRGDGRGRRQVPRGGVGDAAVRGARAARAARHRLRAVRAAGGRGGGAAARRRRAGGATRAGRDALVARARGGHVLHAAGRRVPAGAAHAPRARRGRLPAARAHRPARQHLGGERGQHDRAQHRGRVPGRAPASTRRDAFVADQDGRQRGSGGGGCVGRGAGAAARRRGRGAAGRGRRGAGARAGGAAGRARVRAHAGARPAAAAARAGRLARAAGGRGRVLVPAARAAVGGGRGRQQQGAGGLRGALRSLRQAAPAGLPARARAHTPRARAVPQPRHEAEVQSSLAGRDDPDDDLLVTARGARVVSVVTPRGLVQVNLLAMRARRRRTRSCYVVLRPRPKILRPWGAGAVQTVLATCDTVRTGRRADPRYRLENRSPRNQ